MLPWPGEPGAPTFVPAPLTQPQGGLSPSDARPPCLAEFARLREEVEKKGMAAKAASRRKASREEMCRCVTSYADAETKWVAYTEAHVWSCGIPAQVANQLKEVHANTEQTNQKICMAGPLQPAGDWPARVLCTGC